MYKYCSQSVFIYLIEKHNKDAQSFLNHDLQSQKNQKIDKGKPSSKVSHSAWNRDKHMNRVGTEI